MTRTTSWATSASPPRTAGRPRRRRFLDRLNAIPDTGLSPADRVNKAILKRGFEECIEGNRFGQRMMLFTNRGGWHQSLAGLSENLDLPQRAPITTIISSGWRNIPRYNDEALQISTRAMNEGYTLPCVAMTGFEDTISGVIRADPDQVAAIMRPSPRSGRRTSTRRPGPRSSRAPRR